MKAYLNRVGINPKDQLANFSLRNWFIKYVPGRVKEKLNSVSGYVKKSKKKLDYMQKVLVKEFEETK